MDNSYKRQNETIVFKSLADSLKEVDRILMSGGEFNYFLLRELAARWEEDDNLRTQVRELCIQWPVWTRRPLMEAVMLSIARKNGETRPFVALEMELKQHAPDETILPLDAWSVFASWLSEGGVKCGADLPGWVWEYLSRVAANIQELRAERDIAGSKKLGEIAEALEFSGKKRSVFVSDEAKLFTDVAALVYDVEGHSGLTGEARIAKVAEITGVSDIRTARRYVAKGRKDQRPLPSWAK